MDNFYDYDYLVIDKMGDHLYFKRIKFISKYFNLKDTQVCSIISNCKNNYNTYHYKHKLYIQRLYNNPFSRQPKNTDFLWSDKYINQELTKNNSYKKNKVYIKWDN